MSYTSLGEFTPARAPKFVPYARRAEYKGGHHIRPSRSPRAFLRWASSALRDLGDSLLGSFATA